MEKQSPQPSLWLSLFPLAFLMALLAANIALFGDEASSGANQLALLAAAAVAMGIGRFFLGIGYHTLERTVLASVTIAMQAVVILLVVGTLIGMWILSGIVPAMVYYGIRLINPAVFLLVACLTCSIVSLAVGSSWSTMGTVGVALVAVGRTLGLPDSAVAGAIISGAYFGDKMSPLSDTTNLAPAAAGTDLFTHIRHMFYTTIPAYTLALAAFIAVGLLYSPVEHGAAFIDEVAKAITTHFHVRWYLLLPPLIVIALAVCRVPALPALIAGVLLGAATALLFQRPLLAGGADVPLTLGKAYETLVVTAHSGFTMASGNELIDTLFSRGGMLNMLPTILLILTAMVFGGAMEATGMLPRIARALMTLVHGTGSLVGATIGSCILFNLTAPDQYLSIVIPGRMFRSAYHEQGLAPRNLSRALEDGGTVTSVLIPWNTCGAFAASVLTVTTFTYLPFCFFNLLSPVISVSMAALGMGIVRNASPDHAS